MKTITCLDCERQFSGETAEAIMEQMMEHYLADHPELMDPETAEPRDGWFMDFNQRWDEAPEQ